MNTWFSMSVATTPPLFSEGGAGAPQRPWLVTIYIMTVLQIFYVLSA